MSELSDLITEIRLLRKDLAQYNGMGRDNWPQSWHESPYGPTPEEARRRLDENVHNVLTRTISEIEARS